MAALYDVKGLGFEYPLGKQRVPALRDIDLAISPGDFVCIAGPSGSGKSTLLNVLGLIEPVQQGTVRFEDQDLADLGEREKNGIRKFHLGFVFQQFHLIPVLNAQENVEYFLTRQRLPSSERKERVREALAAVDLLEHRTKRPNEMSGGQRQRVAIARAIAKHPHVIIADEMTASLDQANGRAVMELIRTLNHEQGVTVIMASHDPMVLEMVDKIVRLRDGSVVEIDFRSGAGIDG